LHGEASVAKTRFFFLKGSAVEWRMNGQKENDCMKTRSARTCRTMVQLLIPGLALALHCGCSSVDTRHSDTRAWGRATEFDQREEQRSKLWWIWPWGDWPAVENQQAEEWRNRH
jgi:hypothetical protein